jgi:hypothetical protein
MLRVIVALHAFATAFADLRQAHQASDFLGAELREALIEDGQQTLRFLA